MLVVVVVRVVHLSVVKIAEALLLYIYHDRVHPMHMVGKHK